MLLWHKCRIKKCKTLCRLTSTNQVFSNLLAVGYCCYYEPGNILKFVNKKIILPSDDLRAYKFSV